IRCQAGGCRLLSRSSSAPSSSPSASVDLPSVPIEANGFQVGPSAQHPLSPRRREIARRHPSFAFFELGPTWRYAQASIRVQSQRGQSQLTKYERRRHSPGRRFLENTRPSCHASGSSFPSRHVHLDRLNGSHFTHAWQPSPTTNSSTHSSV